MSLHGDPRSAAFLLLLPAFCFPALEHLHQPEEIAEQNAFIAGRFAHCFPAVSSLAVYCRDPSTLANLQGGAGRERRSYDMRATIAASVRRKRARGSDASELSCVLPATKGRVIYSANPGGLAPPHQHSGVSNVLPTIED